MDINTEIDRKEQILKLISRFSDKPSKAQVTLFFEKSDLLIEPRPPFNIAFP